MLGAYFDVAEIRIYGVMSLPVVSNVHRPLS